MKSHFTNTHFHISDGILHSSSNFENTHTISPLLTINATRFFIAEVNYFLKSKPKNAFIDRNTHIEIITLSPIKSYANQSEAVIGVWFFKRDWWYAKRYGNRETQVVGECEWLVKTITDTHTAMCNRTRSRHFVNQVVESEKIVTKSVKHCVIYNAVTSYEVMDKCIWYTRK